MASSVFVLGLGSIGLRHAKNFAALHCAVIAFDPDHARRKLAREAGIEVVDSREALLARTIPGDCLVIASPNRYHASDLDDGITCDLHLFVEKPIVHVVNTRLNDSLSAHGERRVIFPAMNLRYHPAVARMRELLDSGAIGTPLWGRFHCSSYLPDWRPDQDHRAGYAADPVGGGVVLDIVHEFDLAWHLLGDYRLIHAEAVETGRIDLGADDMATALLRHGSGARSTVHVDYVTKVPFRKSMVGGDKGWIEVDLVARRLLSAVTSGPPVEERFSGDFSEDYKHEASEFLACIAGDRKPACAVNEAISVVAEIQMMGSKSSNASAVE